MPFAIEWSHNSDVLISMQSRGWKMRVLSCSYLSVLLVSIETVAHDSLPRVGLLLERNTARRQQQTARQPNSFLLPVNPMLSAVAPPASGRHEVHRLLPVAVILPLGLIGHSAGRLGTVLAGLQSVSPAARHMTAWALSGPRLHPWRACRRLPCCVCLLPQFASQNHR